ncbi:MAG TPA: hypothetical protein PLS79_13140, partial [Caldilinea sp.]|nr:hypothetical protein [Caldilinea sp.]
MAQSREPRAVRRLDMSKYAVLLVLAVAAIVLLTTRSCRPQLTLLAPTPAATQAPIFTAEAVLARPVLVSPLTGSTVAPGEIELNGEGVRGYSIRVRDESGRLLAAANVAADGAWTTTATIDQPGDAVLSLELVNLAGNVVAAAEPLTLTVGVPSVAIHSPSLDKSFLDATLTAGLLALSGGGEPGSTVQVVVDGAVATSTEVDQNGRWAVDLRVNAPGVYAVGLQAVDAGGVIIATATPSVLSIAAPVRAVEPVPPTATVTPELLSPAVVDSIIVTTDANSSRVAADGKGDVGAEVQLLLGDTVVATTTIGATGSWSLVIALEQPDAYAIGVRALEPESGVEYDLAAPPRGVVVAVSSPVPSPAPTDTPLSEETAPQSPLPTATMTATVTPLPTVASIPTEMVSTEMAPPSVDAAVVGGIEQAGAVPLSGSGAPGDVVRVVIDGLSVGTTVVDAQGRWQMLVELADSGVYSMTVESISLAGQVRATSAPLLLDVPSPTDTATPVPTDTATAKPTATDTATATPVPTDTSVPTNTATVKPTATDTATATPVPTDTPVPTTVKPTATDTATATLVPTDTPIPTSTVTAKSTATNTATATPVPTDTPVLTSTATAKPTATDTATATLVPTDTPIPTSTATAKPTATATATATLFPTDTPAPTNTATATLVPTDTATAKPTATDTATATLVPTDTPVPTNTATAKPTATNTATATFVPTDTPAPTSTASATPVSTDTPVPTNTATVKPMATSTATATIVPTVKQGRVTASVLASPATASTATATTIPTNT